MSIGLMALVLSAAGYQGVQPLCTPEIFQKALGSSSQEDHIFIAQTAFDDYLEQIRIIDTTLEEEKNIPPVQILSRQMEIETKADALFDDLLSSLAALDNSNAWNLSIANLRRTVLLRARKSTNPWPATVWVDVPNFTAVPNSVIMKIDAFIQANIDEDRKDRFQSSVARAEGDSDFCRENEKKAMMRWAQYLQLVEPYVNEKIEFLLYPKLDSGDDIHMISNWIYKNVNTNLVIESAKKQVALWSAVSTQRKQAVVRIVKNARERLGFDPWSSGCGQPMHSTGIKVKNDLLQKSAETQEFNNTTYGLLLGLLSSEQRQRFEEEK